MRALGVTLLAVAALSVAFLAPMAAAEDPISIIAFDDYDRETQPGENLTFEWSVRNTDVIHYNITVALTTPQGFQAALSVESIQDLAPNRAFPITLRVTTPATIPKAVEADFTVRFTVYDGAAVVFVDQRTAHVSISSIYAEKSVLGLFANPLPPPLDNEWGVFFMDVVLWLLIAVLVSLLIQPVITGITKRTKTEVDDIILRIVRKPLVILLFFSGTLNSLRSLDRYLPEWFITGASAFYGVVWRLILIYVCYRIFKDVILHFAKRLARRTGSHVDDVVLPVVEKLGFVVLALATFGLLLDFLNFDLTLFVAGGVVTSMVIAFAAQDMLSNFFAGMFLITERPFREGDLVVQADGQLTEVRRIGLRTTRFFRYSDASMITVPNNKLAGEILVNFSNPQDAGQVTMRFSIGFGADPEAVKRIIRGAIDDSPDIVKDDPKLPPVIRFDELADASLSFLVVVPLVNREKRFAVRDYLNTEVYKRLTAAGIEIPFPQRTVHLKFDPPAPPTKGKPPRQKEEEPRGVPTATSEVRHTTAPAVEPSDTVGDMWDRVVAPAATIPEDATVRQAVEAILRAPQTRKAYVVDSAGKPTGLITVETLMRHAGARLAGGKGEILSFVSLLRDIEKDGVADFKRAPAPITKETRLSHVARLIVDEKLHDLPVVDEQGRLIGELNSLKLLEAMRALFPAQTEETNP